MALTHITLSAMVLSLGACAPISRPFGDCNFDDIQFLTEFPAASLDGCRRISAKQFALNIEPENLPINDSPWYAFQVVADTAREIQLELFFEAGTARYTPKVSRDGDTWRTLKHDRKKDSFKFNLDVGPDKTWIAGQEIIDNQDYQRWMASVSQASDAEIIRLGFSSEGRPIDALKKAANGDEWLVLVGRQHPPETTGAIALLAFTETLLQDRAIDNQFWQRFNLLVVPNLNPDGVEKGNWRHNAGGVDLNRDWKNFSQPETKAVHEYLAKIVAGGGKIVFALDFHSTRHNVFYTMPADYPVAVPTFTQQWLEALAARVAPFEIKEKPGHNPDKGVFKQYIADTYGVHAATYEMGDETDREEIKTVAEAAAETLKSELLSLDQ